MRIGIIGSGNLGGTIARLAVGAGHVVAVANTRGPNSLNALYRDLRGQARAGTTSEVAIGAQMVVLALPFERYRELPVEPFRRKLVVDATNRVQRPDGSADADASADAVTSTQLIAGHLDRARVVKAFNTMPYETLASAGQPNLIRDRRLALFIAGDDPEAKAAVAELVDQLGFAAVDTGSLADGGRLQQPGSPIHGVPLTGAQARSALVEHSSSPGSAASSTDRRTT